RDGDGRQTQSRRVATRSPATTRGECLPKKSAGLGSSQIACGARERTLIVLELRPHFPLADLLRAAELARSSFYYQLTALRTGDKHCDLKAKIREIFNRHKGRYGYRRVTAELRQQGLVVNHKTIQKLM